MEQTNTLKMGSTIAALRKSRGLTQEQLAALVGVSGPAGRKWETAASGPVAPAQSAPASAQKPASAPAVTESVLTKVSPEVVEKVTGHAEGATSDHVQITDRMPDYLL